MKTHNTALTAMGLVFLVSFFFFGCAGFNTGTNMNEPMGGSKMEMTEPAMSDSMEPMKTEMGGTGDPKMEETMMGNIKDSKNEMNSGTGY